MDDESTIIFFYNKSNKKFTVTNFVNNYRNSEEKFYFENHKYRLAYSTNIEKVVIKHYNIKEKFLFLFYKISKGINPEVIVYLTVDIQNLEKIKKEFEDDKYLKECLGL